MNIEPNYKNKKSYNAAKKPMHQNKFWTGLIWLLSRTFLTGKKYTVEKINMDSLKPPYMMLSNHMAFIDFELAAMGTWPHSVSNVVNIDGYANRIAAIAYGPENVLMIVGMNKVAKDIDAAVARARNVAAPTNAQRFDLATPCKKTGSCADCKSKDTICCEFLITRFSRQTGRIKVILVGETLGY